MEDAIAISDVHNNGHRDQSQLTKVAPEETKTKILKVKQSKMKQKAIQQVTRIEDLPGTTNDEV